MNSLVLGLLATLGAAANPTYSCVPAIDGRGWECFEGRRAPQRALVVHEQRPLVDNPWQAPEFSPLQPDSILLPAERFSWQPDFRSVPVPRRTAQPEQQRARQSGAINQAASTSRQAGYWVQLAAARLPQSIMAIVEANELPGERLHVSRDERSGLWLLLLGPLARYTEAEALQQGISEQIPGAYIRARPDRPPVHLDQWRDRHAG